MQMSGTGEMKGVGEGTWLEKNMQKEAKRLKMTDIFRIPKTIHHHCPINLTAIIITISTHLTVIINVSTDHLASSRSSTPSSPMLLITPFTTATHAANDP